MNNAISLTNYVTPSQSVSRERQKRAAAELAEKLINENSEDRKAAPVNYPARKKKRDEMIEKALLAMSTVQGSYLEAEKNVPRRYVNGSAMKSASNLEKREFIPMQNSNGIATHSHLQSPDSHSLSYSCSLDGSPTSICGVSPIAATDVCPSFIYSRQYSENRSHYWREIPTVDSGKAVAAPSILGPSTTATPRGGYSEVVVSDNTGPHWWDSVQFFQQSASEEQKGQMMEEYPSIDQPVVMNNSIMSLDESQAHRYSSVATEDKSVQVNAEASRYYSSIAVQTDTCCEEIHEQRRSCVVAAVVHLLCWTKDAVKCASELFEQTQEQTRLLPVSHSLYNM